MNSTKETFRKSERLCSRKVISGLFESGNIFYTPLFKIVWEKRSTPSPGPAQVTFSVSKRGFRHAVTRNLIKRRLREAYRKNKEILYEHLVSENIQIAFVVIVRGNTIPDYITIEKSVKEMVGRLKKEVGSRKSEDRSPKKEVGSQKSEVGITKSAILDHPHKQF